jgi:hypothetical protein
MFIFSARSFPLGFRAISFELSSLLLLIHTLLLDGFGHARFDTKFWPGHGPFKELVQPGHRSLPILQLGPMFLRGHTDHTLTITARGQLASNPRLLRVAQVRTLNQIKKHGHSRIDLVHILAAGSAAPGKSEGDKAWIKGDLHK